jgi:spore germination protein GerM
MTRRAQLALVAALGLAGACGVDGQDQATQVDADQVPFGLLDTTSTTSQPAGGGATNTVDVCLARDDSIVVVPRRTEADVPIDAAISLLEAGPVSDAEAATGLRTEVPERSVREVELTGGIAVVALGGTFTDLQADAQLTAVGQLVCTLTAQPGVGQVRFTLDGADIDVPSEDGSLTAAPLTRDDFRHLIVDP